ADMLHTLSFLNRAKSRTVADIKPELRVGLTRRYKFMRMRFDAWSDAEKHTHYVVFLFGDLVQHIQLIKIVHDDAANIRVNRHLQFFRRLVVAVEMNLFNRESGAKSGIQFAVRHYIKRHAFFFRDTAHRHYTESFTCI